MRASLTLYGVFGENKKQAQRQKTRLHNERVRRLVAATGMNMKQHIITQKTSPRTLIRQQTFLFIHRFHEF